MGAHKQPRGLVAVLVDRFEDGEKLSAAELGMEFWPNLAPHRQYSYASMKLQHVRKWFIRRGKLFGNVDGYYQLLEEGNVLQDTANQTKLLKSWTKKVQDILSTGMEQFAHIPALTTEFEKAQLQIQEDFVKMRRRQLQINQ